MTAAPEPIPLREIAPGRRVAALDGKPWLRSAMLLRSDGKTVEVTTGEEEESGLLVLSGTHDLEANAGSWVSRGTRRSPFDGRPVALFLPPKTRFRASRGSGELLLLSARRPEPPRAEPPDPKSKPLLPLAGSNQAYDSASGTWKPIESFPDSPEAILPRRIERTDVAGVAVERVFPLDYKARGLALGEAVLPDGASLEVPSWLGGGGGDGYPAEWALYYRAEGDLVVGTEPLPGDGILYGRAGAELRARGGRVYLALVCAGPKPAG